MKKFMLQKTIGMILFVACCFNMLSAQQTIDINAAGKSTHSTLSIPSYRSMTLFKEAERYRLFEYNRQLNDVTANSKGDTLLLGFFDNKQYKSVIQRVTKNPNGITGITSKIAGSEFGYCYMAVSDNSISISAELPLEDEYFYASVKDGQAYMAQCKLSDLRKTALECSGLLPLNLEDLAKGSSTPKSAGDGIDDPVTIDLLFVYTPAAKQWAHTDSYQTDIDHLITLALQRSNTVMVNSGTGITFNVVYQYMTDYEELNTSDDLYRITNIGDGYMDEVHALRDLYHADVVVFIPKVEFTGGLAWLLNNENGFTGGSHAFALCRVQQASWSYTVVHEVGHNMGCGHHAEQSTQPGPGLFPYSSGWRGITNNNTKYSTIMTYEDGSYFGGGENYPRIPYFSSPDINYEGVVIGDAAVANNVLTLKKTKGVTAAYRDAPAAYTVTFNAGAGTCSVSSLTEASGGAGITLPTATPTEQCETAGYTFAGWATTSVTETTTAPTLYAAGTVYNPTEDCTLYAVYSKSEAQSTYALINTNANLESGKKYLVASGTSGEVNVMVSRGSATSTNNQGATAETVASSQIILGAGSTATPFILEKDANDDWTFSDGTYYLTATNTTSANYLKTTSSLDAYARFSITFNDEKAVVTCTGKTSRNIMRYNLSSSLFACYSSGQNDIYLFKEVSTTVYNSNPDCTVLTPGITASTTTVPFGSVVLNTAATPATVTITGENLTDDILLSSLSATDFSATTLTGWNSREGGNIEISYTPTTLGEHNATLVVSSGTLTKDITLSGTGVQLYTVTFNAGAGTCSVSSLTEASGGAGITLPTATPTEQCETAGYTFAGWATTSVAETTTAPILYPAGSIYKPTEDCTLYAVYVKILEEAEIATVGFESSEGFDASTIYNNTAPNNQGTTGKQWAFIMGTPSTTDAMDGLQSAQMRSYANNTNKGSVTMLYDHELVTKVTFNAKYSNGSGSLNVYLSTNSGNTWSTATTQALTTAKESYTYNINASDIATTMRIKFENPTINVAGRVYVDNVKFYRENKIFNSNPDCSVLIPNIVLSTTAVDFGDVNINTAATPATVTITGENLTDDIVLSGLSATDFSATTLTGWNSQTGGNIEISYTPTTLGEHNATLVVGSGTLTREIELSGTGFLPAPVATPATDIAETSFVANWNAVQGATEYELSVYTKGQGANLLSNPDFESGNTDGWSFESAMNQTASTEQVHSGEYSLYALVSATKKITQIITVNPGETYNLSFWYYLDPSTTGSGFRVWTTNGATIQLPSLSTYFDTKGSWQKVEATFTPSGNSMTFELRLYNGCEIYLDDFSITSMTALPVSGSPFTVSGTSYTVNNLDPETTYYYTVKAKVGTATSEPSNEIEVTTLAAPIIPVTNITDVPTTATAGTPLTLTGTVVPNDATNQTIEWSVKNAGTTGATITGDSFTATAAGSATITATITDGTAVGTDYTQDFVITVNAAFVPVTNITDVPTTATAGTPLTLTGTVIPNDATNQTIEWSVQNAGTTGAAITGDSFTATAAGAATVTATITDGTAVGTDYTQDFVITVIAIPTYTVTFNAGAGTCSVSSLTEASGGAGITLPTATPTEQCETAGYTFAGWATTSVTETTTAPTLYAAGTVYNPTEDCTLYAVYSKSEVQSTYALINTNANLESGKKYLVASGTSGEVNVMVSRGSATSTNNQGATAETVASSQIILGAGSTATPFILEKDANDDWTFSDGTYYLTATNTTSANYLKTTSSLDAYARFSITFNDDKAVVTCTGKTSRNIMRYNLSSSLFACYSSGQNDIYLFKEVSTTVYNSNPDCTPLPETLTVTPTVVAFGNVTINTPATTQAVAVTGENLTNNITYTITGANATMFSAATTTGWTNLVGGDLEIGYTPTTAGNHSATLTVSSGTLTEIVALSGTGIGTYTITASVDGGNGTISPSGAVTVTQGGSQSFTFTPDAGYVVSQVLVNGTNNASAIIAGNYTFTNVRGDSTIVVKFEEMPKQDQTITWNQTLTATYGDAPITLDATASSSLTVTYTSSNTNVATVSDNILTIINAGTATITASQAGNNDYNPAADVIKVLTVNPKAVTVTADAKAKTYGDSDPALTYQVSPALISGDSFTGDLSRVAGENAGTYTIEQGTLALSNNYTLTYVPNVFTITTKAVTVTADAKAKTYGDSDPALTYQVSPALISGDSFTGDLSRVAGEDAGTYTIEQGSLALNNNYTLAYMPNVFTITTKAVTVTADAKAKVYGDSDPALTYQVSPALISGDSFTGDLSRVAGEDAGTYTIEQGTLALSNNYTLTYVPNVFTITTKAVTVTADSKAKVYGDGDPALTYQVSPALISGDSFTGDLSRVAGEDAGTYTIEQGTLALSNNYTLTYVPNVFTITTKAVTVTADAKAKTYGDGDPALTYQVSPALISGDSFTGDLSRVAGEDAGTYTIERGTLALNNNYTLTYVPNVFTITTKAVTVTADNKSKTVGQPDPALTYQITSGSLMGADAFTGNIVRDAGETAGTYTIRQGNLALTANYKLTFVNGVFTIGTPDKEDQTIAWNQTLTATYGDAPITLDATASSSLTVTYTSSNTNVATVSDNILTIINAGTATITASQAGNNDYNPAADVIKVLTVNPKAVTVTIDAKAKVYGDGDPALTYQVSPDLVSGDSFTGDLSRVAGEDAGTYTIEQGTLALSNNYMLTYVTNVFTITTKAVTVTADAKAKTYGDSDPALTYQVSPALISGDSFTGDLSRVAGEDAGTYTIEQGTLALNNNYTLTYVPNVFTITTKAVTVTADAKAKTYGDGDPALTYQVSPALISGDSFTGDLSRVAGEDAGTYTIEQGSLALSNNYTLTYVPNVFTITTKAVTVTADNKSKTVGQPDPALTYQITSGSLMGADAFTGNIVRDAGETAGTYTIRQGNLALTANYNLTFVNGVFTIGTPDKQDQTITWNQTLTATYGDAPITLDATASSSLTVTYTSSNTNVATVSDNILTIINAGTATITASQAGNNDYNPAADVIKVLTVNKAPLTITADDQSKVYGEGKVLGTTAFTISTMVGSDVVTSVKLSSTGIAATSPAGTYAIVPSAATGSGLSNYAITYINGVLTVDKRTITVTAASGQAKIYGASDPVKYTYSYAPALVSGDSFTGTLSRVAGENAGTYTIEQGTLALSSNYTLVYVSDVFTITPKAITVTADKGQRKVYGADDPIYSYSVYPSLISGDSFTGALSRVAGEDVGTYAIEQGDLSLSANYTLTFVSNVFTITPKSITVTATGGQTKVYGEDDPAEFTYSVSPDLLDNDSFTGALARVEGENVGTYQITKGTLALSSNYTLSYVPANFTITPKAVTVTANSGQTKVYGAADPTVFAYTVSPALVEGDVFYGKLSRMPGENVGSYTITQGTLKLNSNYKLTYVFDVFTITSKTITITVTAGQSKEYGAADPTVYAYTVSPALTGTDGFTGALTRVSGENVGTYTINQGTLKPTNNNYTVTYVSDVFTITPKAVTVTARSGQTKLYGDSDPAEYTYTVNPSLVTGDSFTGKLGRAVGENVGTYTINQGNLALNANYTLTFVSNVFTIMPKAVTVIATAGQSKMYGDNDPSEFAYTVNPALKAGDSFTGKLGRTAGEAIGSYVITQGTLALNNNYTINYVSNVFTITPKPITVTANSGQTKVYGTADPAEFTYTVTPALAAGDSFTGKLTRVAGENVGSYAINQGTLKLNSNYAINYVSANFSITKAVQTINFEAVPVLKLADSYYLLKATATSGLPVKFRSSNPAIAEVQGSALMLRKAGTVTVTAYVEANPNYEAANEVAQTVTIMSSSDGVISITVDGATYKRDKDRYVVECGLSQVRVTVTAENAKVFYKGVEGNVFTVDTPRPDEYHVTFTVTAEDGSQSKDYTIVLEKRFDFNTIVTTRWNNTLTVINNPANNGGYSFTSYNWYRKAAGSSSFVYAGSGQYYSAGPRSTDKLNPNDEFYVEMMTSDGKQLSTCTGNPQRSAEPSTLTAYPNPTSGPLTVECGYPEPATIELFDMNGRRAASFGISEGKASIDITHLQQGIYVLKVANETVKIVKQ